MGLDIGAVFTEKVEFLAFKGVENFDEPRSNTETGAAPALNALEARVTYYFLSRFYLSMSIF